MTTPRTDATSTTTTAAAATPSAAAPAVGAFSAADETFFRITASLFAPSFLFGAGVLLATYDDEDEPAPGTSSTVGQPRSTTLPASTSVPA